MGRSRIFQGESLLAVSRSPGGMNVVDGDLQERRIC